jgi:hypothetical protein
MQRVMQRLLIPLVNFPARVLGSFPRQMNIYVDQLMQHGSGSYHGHGAFQAARVGAKNGHWWCHLIADEADCPELHAFAARIGMKRSWFQGDHYDLGPGRRAAAVAIGAIEVDRKTFVEIRRRQKERNHNATSTRPA